jgi:hypothetical protein
MALENKVEASKGKDYGAHAKLLLKLRQAKLKERLEESRVAFDRKFNLSEEQWLSWLDDKTKELYECASGKKRKGMEVRVQELFERATATLPASVSVWLKYLSFSVAKTSEDTEEDRRQFYERSCKIVAKDYKRGDAFWLAYRAFECSQNDDSSQKKNRIQMVSTRALETPLEKLDELKEKIIAGVENRDELGSYTKAYEVGRKRRDLRKAFEDKIEETASKNITTQKSDPKANLRAYRSYIAMEKTLHKREKNKGLNESVQSLYERALLKNSYVVCLWIEYAMEFSSSKIDILHRALRACPSSFELLIEQIDSSADDSDIQTVNVSVTTEAFANLLENSSLKRKLELKKFQSGQRCRSRVFASEMERQKIRRYQQLAEQHALNFSSTISEQNTHRPNISLTSCLGRCVFCSEIVLLKLSACCSASCWYRLIFCLSISLAKTRERHRWPL